MRFPIANISIKEWNPLEDYVHYILMDPFIYNNNEDFFKTFYLNQKFVDSEGNIFKVVDKRLPTSWWRKTFHFLPDVYKITLVFVKTGEKMGIEDVRQFIIKQVTRTRKADNTSEWLAQIKRAKTIQEILGGE